MSSKIKNIVFALLGACSVTIAQDWPYNGGYVYFGASTLDQTQVGNYALLQHKGNGTTYLNSPEILHLRIGNNDQLTVASDGDIGIGTTSPNDRLEVRDGRIRVSNGSDRMYFGVENDNSKSIIAFGDDYDDRLAFYFDYWNGSSNDEEIMSINANGRVGIGTTAPDSKLTVKGNIHAEEVKVDLNVPGPDYVFDKDYDLKSLEEVQSYINQHGHLANIPSATEMEENGIDLGEMNMRLLEKIEELTLYTLQQEHQLKWYEDRIQVLEQQNARIAIIEEKLKSLNLEK